MIDSPDFLHAVAANLFERYGEGVSQLNIVFPSRRARLFFTDALVKQISKPLWQPAYLSMEDLVKQISPLKQADDYSLLIDLYKLYTKHKQSDETFDHFYFWGETLLNDFDTIDKYMVNAESLFQNLSAQKMLEGDFTFLSPEQVEYIQLFWSTFDPKNESNLQNQFVEVWAALLPIYNDFKAGLLSKNEAYEGMIYRDMVQRLSLGNVSALTNKQYVFVGFNALNECEKELFRYLKQLKQADFYWDYDEYYLQSGIQEAGYFLRQNIQSFPPPESFDIVSSFNNSKKINIVSAPSDVLQAKIIPTLLASMDASLNRRTAIVLADENLLLPVLYSLPDNVEEVNITMGYPLKQTAVYSLIELLIRLQRGSKTSATSTRFYHRDVLSVLNHQYIRLLTGGNEQDQLKADIINYNKVYVDYHFFKKSDLLKLIFKPISDYTEMTDYFIDIFSVIARLATSGDSKDDDMLRREYIYHLVKALNQLKKSIDAGGISIGLPVFLSLLRSIFSNLRIPFTGEPIKGLQVMGLLETRTLDFDNLIILSLNEGILPRGKSMPSFVPYHLRRGFNLPAIEQQEAIYAYYFYRLLQRAQNIQLVYSSKSDEQRTGEMSRYLYQLKFESGHTINEQSVTYQLSFDGAQAIVIEKSPEIMTALTNYWGYDAQRSLSPSALSSYIKCPLQFYFRYLANIAETEEVQEELAVNVFGNILHNVMENLYSPHINNLLTKSSIMAMYNNEPKLLSLLDSAFAEEFYHNETLPDDFNENGKLIITRDVIAKYAKGMLLFDANNSPFTPINFEKRISSYRKLIFDGMEIVVKLSGFVDRIDHYNGVVRIIDYKTGAGKGKDKRAKFKGVDSLFSLDPNERNSEVFQTFLYALIYIDEHTANSTPLVPTLYFVRDMYDPNFNAYITDDNKKEEVADFNDYACDFAQCLDSCLNDIFNPDLPFTQTVYTEICTNACAFSKICRR